MSCNQEIATVTYDKLADEVTAGSRILLDDGRVEMKVERSTKQNRLSTAPSHGGVLSNNKGVNFLDVQLSVRASLRRTNRPGLRSVKGDWWP